MTTIERTRQQLDPVGSTGVAPVAIFLAIGSLGYAIAMTVRGEMEISNPIFANIALALLTIAGAIVIFGSRPNRAPLTAGTHAAAHAIAVLAILCEAVGQWGTNAFIRDDWGPVTLGILLVALGPYRPAKEIVGAGILSAITIGFITYLQVPWLVTSSPPLAFIAAALTPMLALCFSAAMFSDSVVTSIERWQKRATAASVSLVRELREGIARSVQQDRITILNRDVLQFFSEVIARDTLTVADRDRARMIADSIRQVMVEEVDRSWLESLLEQAGVERTNKPGAARAIVDDLHRVAPVMTVAQRTAIRALLVVFTTIPGFNRDHLRIVLSRDGNRNHGVITAQIPITDHILRSSFAPFLAVMRAVFINLEVAFGRSVLTLRFSYDTD